MEEIRTLPPLVRGKVTGFLDFFIDEVKIFRNILLLTDKCNVIVQVQWWGEKLPVYIVPERFCSKQNHDISYNFQNTYYHSATYKIKTTLDLFKSYLKTCEVLELAVLRAVEKLVIGSAFMKDLIRLINNIHDPITLPLVDSLGEEIGEIKIHTNFSQGACSVSKSKHFSQSIGNSIGTINSRDIIKDSGVTRKIGLDYVINYESICERCDDFTKRDIFKVNQDLKAFEDKESENKPMKEQSICDKIGFDPCENKTNLISKSNEKARSGHKILSNKREDFIQSKNKSESKSFPQTHMLSDCSKVLYFDVQCGKKIKSSKKYSKTEKHESKNTNANFTKYKKTESKVSNRPSVKLKPSSVKKMITSDNKKSVLASQKTLCKAHEDNEKNQNSVLTDLNTQSNLNCQNSSVNEVGDEKILNYLLGYKMSEDDERSALDDLKRASLSRNFVESINQLCTTSGNFHQKPKRNDNQECTSCSVEIPKSISKKINHLKFDLSNTIERNYYKKFFTTECSLCPFQITEYLNRPKNKFVIENCEKVDNNSVNESSHFHTTPRGNELEKNSLDSVELQGESNNLIEKDDNNKAAGGFWSDEKVPTDCSNCKYYKQFSELDTIIESLKHFDKKIVKRKDN